MNNTGPVIFTMIDGLRPDAVTVEHMPHLSQLMQRGSWSLSASSIMPSVTFPCHMSIFHSVPPTRHGIMTNDWHPMARPLPGLVDVAKAAGLQCAAVHSWDPFRHLSQVESMYFVYYLNNLYTDPKADFVMVEEALRCLDSHKIDFMFVYLGLVDWAGHKYGWMEEGYLAQTTEADTALGQLLAGLPDEATVLVQADHGGHDRTHGTDMPEDMLIPWVISGPGIRQSYEIEQPVSLLDTAPTLAKILGIQPHRDWEGRCLDEIFLE